ncbi:MAG TPA: LysR family transcriptional regulator [Candidatus Limiplasma sp.]|nr:LysR family transcriptional regulator [Candidatus Limiplasma sp.]
MQLEHLNLFLKIAEQKSISKVAGASHISQPALSLQMQKIEDTLGCKLFERSNRGIQLTDAGLITQRYAAQLIFTYNQFLEELNNLRNHNETCRVVATQVAANYAIPCSLVKAKERFPGYTFTLASMPSRDVIRHVMENQADIGFIVGETDDSELYCRNVFSDQIVLVAAADYTVRPSLSLEALKSHPLVLLDESYSSYRMIAEQIKEMGFTLEEFNVSYHLDSTEAVKSMVIDKNGLSFLPYMAVKKEIYLQQLKIVDTEDFCLRYDVSIIFKHRPENNNYQLTTVKKYFENMVPTTIC